MYLLPLVLLTVGLCTSRVRREAGAEPDADPDADPQLLTGHAPLAVHQPECHSVPETTCVPRQVEVPRKVCHQEFDDIVDTVVTEHCEEVITTTCQQVTTKAFLSQAVVGQNSEIVATGVDPTPPVTVSQGAPQPGAVGPPASVVGAPTHHPGAIGPVGPGVPLPPVGPGAPHPHVGAPHPGVVAPHHHVGKRDAVAGALADAAPDAQPDAEAEALADAQPDANPDAAPDANPDADPHYHGPPPPGPPPLVQEGPAEVSPPICNSVPVKHCHNVPTHTPRRVARTICAVHVDITTIEDCEEVITTKCHQTSQTVAHASNVVGHDTRVGPPVVTGHHPVPPLVGPVSLAGPVGVGPAPLGPPLPPLAPPVAPIAPGYGGPPLAPVLPPIAPIAPVAPIAPLAPGYGGPPLVPVLPRPLPGYSGLPIARADSPLAALQAMIKP